MDTCDSPADRRFDRLLDEPDACPPRAPLNDNDLRL
jgi:hypothetical protein